MKLTELTHRETSKRQFRRSEAGQLGKWDNGLYVTGLIQEVPVHIFLVDSGSTTTLISHNVFMRFCGKPTLKISNSVIKDVNGENFKVYGTVQIKINFEKETFEHSVIICDILPEGILGQDSFFF